MAYAHQKTWRWMAFMLVGSGWVAVPETQAQEEPTPPSTTAPTSQPLPPTIAATDPLAVAIVEAHNKLRADEKLPPLQFAPLLARAATIQAADMAEHGEMKHDGTDGSTPADRVRRVGYHFQTSGENVAVFYPDVNRVMQAWVDSPPHKQNILGDFTELGIARVEDTDGKPYWCVDFGKPIPQLDSTEATVDFVTKLNEVRTLDKHPKLTIDTKLATAAQAQAGESAATKGKGGTPTSFNKLDANQYVELAMSTAVGLPTAEAVLKMFLANPSYKERLLGSATKVGVGYATDTEGIPYWCLILGKPRRR